MPGQHYQSSPQDCGTDNFLANALCPRTDCAYGRRHHQRTKGAHRNAQRKPSGAIQQSTGRGGNDANKESRF
jgi:hypothetical protein